MISDNLTQLEFIGSLIKYALYITSLHLTVDGLLLTLNLSNSTFTISIIKHFLFQYLDHKYLLPVKYG